MSDLSLRAQTLEKILLITEQMLNFADHGKWEEVALADSQRKTLLGSNILNDMPGSMPNAVEDQIITDIVNKDRILMEMTHEERHSSIERGAHFKAQNSAREVYRAVMTLDSQG